jgi:hypothetical protein
MGGPGPFFSDLVEPEDGIVPVAGVGQGPSFVSENNRSCLRVQRTWKGCPDLFKLPIVDVKNDHSQVSLAGFLSESIEGGQIAITPGRDAYYNEMLLGSQSRFLMRT